MKGKIMTAITNATAPSTVPTFEELLTKMTPHFRYFVGKVLRFRRDNFDDAMQELITIAYEIYHSLVQRGKAVFYTPIMKFAIKRFREGRRFIGLNTTDVLSPQTQRLGKCETWSLNQMDEDDPDTRYWMEDRNADVFRTVQLQVDFADWYQQQTVRDQWIASDLAQGYTTGEVAKKYGVSPALISIKRRNYANSWKGFIDPPEPDGMLVPA
jgi:hypothetical protein